ncbi:nuclear transport factor 2 family protein [Alterinioella nitratireducens]|uniref:nuclear transport factor 2 family protein n=1 Tax=Alterinioella nitratireducens TaxID=2735915 RepID=UPI001F2A6D5F|nr:nuclear transport factor 2 family protein [Alterinioella nitratireducens]
MIKTIVAASAVLAVTAGLAAAQEEVRPNVFFAGELEEPGSDRALMQGLILDLMTAWADCNAEAMQASVSQDVFFAYPTTSYTGLEPMLADLDAFCGMATDVSFYLPADAFYIDTVTGRIAAEVQFRAFQRGNYQVVNDVWIATVEGGEITIIKEYLDGRVKDLQALEILERDESPEMLTP